MGMVILYSQAAAMAAVRGLSSHSPGRPQGSHCAVPRPHRGHALRVSFLQPPLVVTLEILTWKDV